jgi:UDP-N-acetyl-D-mannosaminuronate dehydrogenase
VGALEAAGATVAVHDPLYGDEELRALGFTPFHLGDKADAVVVQADHAAYRSLTAADVPGVRTLVDGRRVTDAGAWEGVTRRVIGAP